MTVTVHRPCTDDKGDAQIALSLRETRVVVERLLQHAGLPQGVVFPTRDFIIEAELAGLGALDVLHGQLESFGADLTALELVSDNGSRLTLECHGLQSAVVAPAVVDLAADTVHRFGACVLTVCGVANPRLLEGLAAGAHRFGLAIEVIDAQSSAADVGDCTVKAIPDTAAPVGDPLTQLVGGDLLAVGIRDGIPVAEDMWWELHHRSNLALSVDSPASRGHAGANVVDAHGRLSGDPDDHFIADGGLDERCGKRHANTEQAATSPHPTGEAE